MVMSLLMTRARSPKSLRILSGEASECSDTTMTLHAIRRSRGASVVWLKFMLLSLTTTTLCRLPQLSRKADALEVSKGTPIVLSYCEIW